MKFKNLLTKALLVTAGLCVGVSAWGAKTVVGALDNSAGWWSAFSDYYTIEPNGSLTLTFTNYSKGEATYQNWIGAITNDVNRNAEGYKEYLLLRADGYKMGLNVGELTNLTQTYSEGIGIPNTDNASQNNNPTLCAILNGANVILKVTRSGSKITMRYDFTTTSGTEYFQQVVFDDPEVGNGLRFFLVTEGGHIENLCEGAWDNVQTLDFEDAETYTSGWSSADNNRKATISQLNRSTNSKAIMGTTVNSYSHDYYYSFTNSDFASAAIWKFEGDVAFTSAGTSATQFFLYSSASGSNYGCFNTVSKLFMIQCNSGNKTNTAQVYAGDNTVTALTLSGTISTNTYKGSGTAGDDPSKWYHLVVTANPSDGVKLSIEDASGNSVLSATKVCDYVHPAGMSLHIGRGWGKVALDNVKFHKAVNPKVTTHYELSDGTTLIDDVATEVIAGSSFTPSYPTSFQSGTKQYTYVSGGETIASVTADIERTIIYSEGDMPTGTFYAETYEKNGGTTGWTPSNNTRFVPAILGNITNKYFSVDQSSRGQNSSTLTGAAWNQVVDKNTDFTMEFDVQLTNANTDVPTFTIYDYDNSTEMLKLQPTAKSATTWKINDDADNPVTLAGDTWYTIQYSRKGTLTYLTITPTAGGDAVLAQTQITTVSADGGIGKLVFSTGRYNANIALDNVLIRAWQTGDTPEVTETTYTIQYRDEEGNEIKDDVVNPTTVGTEGIAASSAETASFYNNDRSKKYIYKSGNNPITATATAASNVITLVFREAATYSYTVTNNLGTVIANSTGFEQDEIVQPYPRYELKNGKMYTKGATDNEYRVRFTLAEDNQEETITGYADANIAGVVFYKEGENITGATVATAGTKSSRSSNGAVGQNPESAELTVLEGLAPGTYKICATFIKESSNSVTATFKVGEASYSATNSSNITNMASAETEEFTITETSDVIWTNNCNLDYVYIQKTKVSKSVGTYGWATFSSTYALDFSEVAGVTPFIATGSNGGSVTLQSVEGVVAAGTGLLLKSTNGGATTVTIPVAASSGTLYNSTSDPVNYLFAINSNYNLTSSGTGTNYVLSVQNEKVVFARVGDTAAPVQAGQAALWIPASGGEARYLNIVFDDEKTTGINQIANGTTNVDNTVYNLNGQRIAAPAKGLYIVGGKKIIVK